VAYTRFLCLVINNYSSCFGRNILKDPNFDFSRLSPLILDLYSEGLLRLVFNLQNYASNNFYLFSHILSLSCSSLLHPSRVAAAAAHLRSSPPLLAQAHSIGSSLVLATISVLLLSFLPLSFLFLAALRAPPLRSAAPCARHASRVAPGCAARAFPVLPCTALCGAEPRSAGDAQGRTGNARALHRAYLHPYDSACTLSRLSYQRHAQSWHATLLSSCSAAIDAC
jgi:hypothetical protein